MEAFVLGILTVLVIALLVSFFKNDSIYFNTNRYKIKSNDDIVPVEFKVIKIEDDTTQYEEEKFSKPLCKYTILTSFFFKTKTRNYIHNEYIFWDEPNKYNIGDVLTLSNIKESCKK